MFIHLHNHSHYSILEGLPKPKDYVNKAVELGMNAVALTDTANIHGCHEFYKEAKSAGITPIMGAEIFVESSLDPNISHKLVLLAKTLKGYQNIIAIISQSSLDNPGRQAKIPFSALESLKEQQGDLEMVCLSGPLSGEIPFYVLSGKSDEEIIKRVKKYQDIFGAENYFIELLYHEDIPKQAFVTDKLIELCKKYDLQPVAANNNYYVEKEDKKTQDVIMALGTGHEIENPDRPTLANGDYSFLNEEEMQSLFGFLPEALENTNKIASMIDIEIETGGILIPTFELPDEHQKIYEEALEYEKDEYEKGIQKLSSDEWYLRYLSFSGLNWRHEYGIEKEIIFKLVQKLDKPSLDKKLTETAPEELKALSLTYYSDEKQEILAGLDQELQDKIERLEYELVVVNEMGFNAYFLIVADYINWARAQNIPVGPGRGSAAGSLMAFLSGITDIDPLPYNLLFERFLNPARVSMPDIDTDFADTERDKVVEYCRNKYGADHVAQICTFGTFAARAAVKDVGRVMGIPFAEMNELAKLIPEKPGTKLKKALEEAPEFKEAYETNLKYKDIIDNALKIEGNVRQLGVHACAVIIAPQPMTQFTALQHPPKDAEAIVTQYSAYPLEDLGLLKMDFLGLRNLTVIKRAQKIIKNNKGIDVDVMKMDLNDPKVLDIFCKGDTTGVFQFESDGMRKYLKDLAPDKFEDLIAMVSLYRPGPLAYIPTYVDIKHGRKEIAYLTEELRAQLEEKGYSQEEIEEEGKKLIEDLGPILDITYGIAVYQEQLMFLVQYMAGFSLGEADLLRRGVGKKKLDVVEALKKEFIEKGAKFRNYKPETTNYIYTEMIMPAANYSFNKSHAACYAFIAYQTAFLKAYYPTEFLTSLMVSDEENMERVVLEVGECESKGISVLPPSINESLKHFTYIDDTNVRFGLKAIKGVGDGPIEKVIEAREKLGRHFESLEEFIEETGREVINKKSLEALILSGSMDELGERKAMFSSIQNMIQFMKKDEKQKETNQIGLFDQSDDYEDVLELEEVGTFTYEERLKNEKEMIGFFVSGHPLDGLKRYTTRRSRNTKRLKMDFAILEVAHNKKVAEKELLEKQEEEKQAQLEKEAAEKGIPYKKPKKEKKGQAKEEIVQAVGYINDMRKIVTKTGKNMMFFKCEGFDYEFEVVIFPRDFDTYKDKVEIDKIAIVTGALDINFEYKRKSLRAQDIKIASITQVREQARDLGLFDNSKRFVNLELNESEEENSASVGEENITENNTNEEKTEQEKFEQELEHKIQEQKAEPEEQITTPSEFIVVIPASAKKEDLLDLKQFLLEQEPGLVEIFLDLRGQKIPTKVSIGDLESLKKWVEEKWS